MVDAINMNNKAQANSLYLQAEKLSKEIFVYIDNTIEAIERNSKLGVEVLKVNFHESVDVLDNMLVSNLLMFNCYSY